MSRMYTGVTDVCQSQMLQVQLCEILLNPDTESQFNRVRKVTGKTLKYKR